MGGGVSVPVPLSSSQMTILQQKYALYSERGSDDEELGNMLEAKLPGIIVCVARATRAAPRPPYPPPTLFPFVSFVLAPPPAERASRRAREEED